MKKLLMIWLLALTIGQACVLWMLYQDRIGNSAAQQAPKSNSVTETKNKDTDANVINVIERLERFEYLNQQESLNQSTSVNSATVNTNDTSKNTTFRKFEETTVNTLSNGNKPDTSPTAFKPSPALSDKNWLRRASLVLPLIAAGQTYAEVSAEDAEALGTTLTPIGAEKAASEDGKIPAWDGGITEAPANYNDKKNHISPFPDDKPLFTITTDNVSEHEKFLTPGQKALFKTYPDTFKMPVYQSRRTAAYPQEIYDWTKKNATNVKLTNNGNGFTGTVAGYPFPIPGSGIEVMWNHIMRYYGPEGVVRFANSAITQPNGDYELGRAKQWVKFYYNNPEKYKTEKDLENRSINLVVKVLEPPQDAGTGYLVHVPIDRITEPARAWVFEPSINRVKVFENVGYDGSFADGLMTHDQLTQFNGPFDRYTFKLVGKTAIYMPYNSYAIHSSEVKYNDIVTKSHPNTALTRYELHRAWVVEATVREGESHIYQRRTFYIDEDSWNIVAQDIYDKQGKFWRYGESHMLNFYDAPTTLPTVEAHYDVQSGRYVLQGMTNQEPPPDFDFDPKERFFKIRSFERTMNSNR